jgi:hypothetical protein
MIEDDQPLLEELTPKVKLPQIVINTALIEFAKEPLY